jgi:hypothetical protein
MLSMFPGKLVNIDGPGMIFHITEQLNEFANPCVSFFLCHLLPMLKM